MKEKVLGFLGDHMTGFMIATTLASMAGLGVIVHKLWILDKML